VTECPVTSNLVILAAPLLPLRRAFQKASTLFPTGVMAPSPVMTTLFLVGGILLDVVDRVAHGLDLLGRVVGDGYVARVLELHRELDGVEGVRAQVVHERGGFRDLVLGDAELFRNNLDTLGFDFGRRRHRCSSVNGDRSPRGTR